MPNWLSISLHNFLLDKQYEFSFTTTTADVLIVITEFVYQALDKNDEAQGMALDISEAFDLLSSYAS